MTYINYEACGKQGNEKQGAKKFSRKSKEIAGKRRENDKALHVIALHLKRSS
jgi:hypothetical protein